MRYALIAACAAALAATPAAAVTYTATVFASGLNNPRGLAFGPDDALYIAESGVLDLNGPSTVVPRGPSSNVFYAARTGSITRVAGGAQQRIVTGLPSIASPTINEATGPQDIVFGADGTGYVAIGFVTDPAVRATDLAPAGIGLGQLYTFTGGPPAPFADLAALEATNPGGRELNSNPYHVVANGTGFLATDAGANTLLAVAADGTTAILATLPRVGGPTGPDFVPTGVAVGPDGNFYVGGLTGVPFTQGSAGVYRVTPLGAVDLAYTGFTNIGDLAFGSDGSLFVLELDSNGLIAPGGGGRLLQVASNGARTTIFDQGLVTPTGLEIGRDGAFYVANFSAATGIGSVLRIAAVPEPATWATMILGFGLIGFAARRRRGLSPAS